MCLVPRNHWKQKAKNSILSIKWTNPVGTYEDMAHLVNTQGALCMMTYVIPGIPHGYPVTNLYRTHLPVCVPDNTIETFTVAEQYESLIVNVCLFA